MKTLSVSYKCMQGDKVHFEGLFANFLLLPSKLQEIVGEVKKAIQIANPDYDIIIKGLHLYYDMKLVLCNPNFTYNRIINVSIWAVYISSYPLASLPKMAKQEVPASIKQNLLFVL